MTQRQNKRVRLLAAIGLVVATLVVLLAVFGVFFAGCGEGEPGP